MFTWEEKVREHENIDGHPSSFLNFCGLCKSGHEEHSNPKPQSDSFPPLPILHFVVFFSCHRVSFLSW